MYNLKYISFILSLCKSEKNLHKAESRNKAESKTNPQHRRRDQRSKVKGSEEKPKIGPKVSGKISEIKSKIEFEVFETGNHNGQWSKDLTL